MIVVRLMGGLGNQLFQWAYAKTIAEKYQQKMYIDLSLLGSQIPGMTKRSYGLHKFPGISEKEFAGQYADGRPFVQLTDQSPLMSYDPNVNYFVNGYFQNERFLSESSSSIRACLAPTSDLSTRFGIGSDCVSLHVRRTDYLTSNGFHPVQDVDYYMSALSEVGLYDRLFVFSDDPAWCRENLPFENMTVVTGNDEVVDLWLMSLCRDNIIANSSFSWWGAWLNTNPNKKVIYPDKWFGNQEADIACEGWIRI